MDEDREIEKGGSKNPYDSTFVFLGVIYILFIFIPVYPFIEYIKETLRDKSEGIFFSILYIIPILIGFIIAIFEKSDKRSVLMHFAVYLQGAIMLWFCFVIYDGDFYGAFQFFKWFFVGLCCMIIFCAVYVTIRNKMTIYWAINTAFIFISQLFNVALIWVLESVH
jgi:hypothetical protein